MFRSIRWNLLGWQAVVLVTVVAGFGATLFLRVRYATLERVDADLLGAAQVWRRELQSDRSAGNWRFPKPTDIASARRPAERALSRRLGRRGRCKSPPTRPLPIFSPRRDLPRREGRFPFYGRSRGPFREVIVREPWGWQVLVGRQIGRERNELRRLLWWLLGTGLGIVGSGTDLGLVSFSPDLTPVEQMTGIAERISASNLSERIDESRIKSELGRLAQVLNRMFGRLQASFRAAGPLHGRRLARIADTHLRGCCPVGIGLGETAVA